MTLNEYAIKLGLSLNACQIQLLDLIEERKDETLIISFPRLNGRQLMYSLVERKKGYDEGYEQGKLDGAREFAKLLKKKFNEFIDYDDNGEQTFESNPDLIWSAIDEVLAKMQKEVENG